MRWWPNDRRCSKASSMPWRLSTVTLGGKEFLMLQIQCSPDRVRGFSDAVLPHQLPRHGREHVVVLVHVLQPFTGELPFHGQRHQELLAHEAQA